MDTLYFLLVYAKMSARLVQLEKGVNVLEYNVNKGLERETMVFVSNNAFQDLIMIMIVKDAYVNKGIF